MASVRSVFQQSTGGATQTVANPAGATDGDLFLMFCALRDLIDGNPNRVGFPPGWTRLDNAWDGFTNSQILWHRFAASDPGISLSVVGGSALSVALYAVVNAGLPTISVAASGSSLNPDSPAVVIPGSPIGTSVFLSFAGITDGGAGIIISGYPANYNNSTANPIGGGSGAGVGTRALAAATDNPGPFTQVNSNPWNAWTVGVPDINQPPSHQGTAQRSGPSRRFRRY